MLLVTSHTGKNILIYASSIVSVSPSPDLSGVSPSIVANRAIVKSFSVVIFAVNKVAYCLDMETHVAVKFYMYTLTGVRPRKRI
jgi:hypothetical protein